MNDAKSLDENETNDLYLRGSMPRYCRRAPGRQIERGENSIRSNTRCLELVSLIRIYQKQKRCSATADSPSGDPIHMHEA